MRTGISLLLWTTDPADEQWLPLYERLAALGYDGVELPIYDLDPRRWSALGRRLDDLGLARTAGTALGPETDPGSSDPSTRARAADRLRAVVDCCQAAGADLLAGPLYTGLGHFTGAAVTRDEWRHAVDGTRLVAQHADGAGVTLAIEFLNRFETYVLNSSADAARFAREVDHPRCRLMYDTHHAHCEEKSVTAALEVAAPLLAYVHISENDRSTPGSGQVRWEETFRALSRIGYDGWLTIEAFGQALPALVAATKIWRRLYADEETLAREGLAFIRSQWRSRDVVTSLS